MAVPKKKKSYSRSRMRKGGNGSLKSDFTNIITDNDSGEFKLPHHICLDGYYNGKQIVTKKIKKQEETQDK